MIRWSVSKHVYQSHCVPGLYTRLQMKTFVKHFCSKRAALGLALLAGTLQTQTFADGGSIGDLPGYGEDTYFADDAAYDESAYEAPSSQVEASEEAYEQVADQNANQGEVARGVVGSGYYEPIGADQMAGGRSVGQHRRGRIF